MEMTLTPEKTTVNEIIKLVSNSRLVDDGSYTFNNVEEAAVSPAIQKLFYLPFIKRVLVSTNYIALERYNIVEWDDVIDQVIDTLTTSLKTEPILKDQNTSIEGARNIEIYIESTPNPNALKFISNLGLSDTPIDILRGQQEEHPLLTTLFNQYKWISKAFINMNYIALTKEEDATWEDDQHEIRSIISQYLKEGIDFSALKDTSETTATLPDTVTASEYDQKIIDILDEYIKPAVAQDGGDISFHSYRQGQVFVRLSGACSGCPSSTATLKNGIENLLKEMLPKVVEEVIAV